MITGLAGRVAAVTGAGSGIGLATARALAAEGCRIVAGDLDERAVKPLVGELGDSAIGVGVDVARDDAGEIVVDAARGAYGRLDVLVNCAGVFETNAFDEIDARAWDHVVGINLRGTFVCAQAAIPAMAANGWGRIVAVSSIAALTGGLAAGPSYVASKAGVMGLTRSLAHAAGPLGITVNCVNPGVIESPMTKAMTPETRRVTAERTPLGRNGRPEEVAAVIVFLASEGAAFVNGAHLSVNGGLLMD